MQMGRSARIFLRAFVVLAVVVPLAVAAAPASAGEFTVTLTPSKWCSPAPYGAWAVTTDDAPYFKFACSGAFIASGDPAGTACCGATVDALIYAPPGVVLTNAVSFGSVFNLNNGSGWVGGSYFNNGGTSWTGSGSLTDPPFTSNFWGLQVRCTSTCTGSGGVDLTSVTLTATEDQGPSLAAEGSGDLWNQNRPGEWVWNPPGDTWPMTLTASDPTGVCSMEASRWRKGRGKYVDAA